MSDIKIEKPEDAKLAELGIKSWPIWEKEVSSFPWHYDQREVCYLLEGKVKVEPKGAPAVEFGAGDLVTFPEGMDCTWIISEAVRKHYRFG